MDGTFTVWLHAFISVIIISILGLVPIICMPRLQRTKYQNDLLQLLIGLAIGTLTADALLHLLPISGTHRHTHGDQGRSLSSTNNSSIAAHESAHLDNHNSHSEKHRLLSIGEINLEGIHSNNDKDPRNSNHLDHIRNSNYNTNASIVSGNSYHAANNPYQHSNDNHLNEGGFWFGFMALIGIIGFLVLERLMVLLADGCTHSENSSEAAKADGEIKDSTAVACMSSGPHVHQNHHQHQHHQLNSKTKSFMFMIITGDGLHNFFDGIAIGVSYGSSFTVGLSTSIAILCHELPHEIGDFAVLIKSGMTIKRAVLYNTLSSILCLLGATTGVFIGRIDVGWVSALIAGMFLYISLVDMVPQLDCYPNKPAVERAKKLLIQLSGIGFGVAIMGLIATYEARLHSIISNYNQP